MQRVKRVLLVEALANSGGYLLDAARALGVEAFVATHADVYDSYPEALRRDISGTVFTDLTDPRRALADLEGFCRAEGIDGVAGCWEFFTPLVARLAARLGLPGNVPELAEACRNKAAMAEAFHVGGVPAPGTVVADTCQRAAEAIAGAGLSYPLVVKPAEQGGSWGVSVVRSADGLERAVAEAQAFPVAEPHGLLLDQRVVVLRFLTPPRGGVFRGVRVTSPGPDLVKRHLFQSPGTSVPGPRGNSARVGHLLVTAPTPGEANAAATTALAHTSVEVS